MGGHSLVVTDFCLRASGFEHIVVLVDPGTPETRAGRICQRLLELETYRLRALRGLPAAKALATTPADQWRRPPDSACRREVQRRWLPVRPTSPRLQLPQGGSRQHSPLQRLRVVMSEDALKQAAANAARKPHRPRNSGRLATVLGKMADIKKALFELLGPDRLQSLHPGMSVRVATSSSSATRRWAGGCGAAP